MSREIPRKPTGLPFASFMIVTEVSYITGEPSFLADITCSDFIGIPVRLVVSEKSGDKIEWKERTSDNTELLPLDEVIKRMSTGE